MVHRCSSVHRSLIQTISNNPQFRGAHGHSPSIPRKTVGPSISFLGPDWERTVEGDTTSNATLSCKSNVGARKAKSDRMRDVRARRGAR